MARLARRSRRLPPPVPPAPLPPGRTVLVPGRGEFFLRDTGGDGPPVLLVHGWMFPSDLNWLASYRPLRDAGYRVLAMDLRGHGRGLRSGERFRLADCADDAAAVLGHLGIEPVLAVGYSMGGPVTQLLARRHPERVAGFVLCATALDWSDPRQKVVWRTMGGLRLLLGLFPRGVWTAGMRLAGAPSRGSNWVASELSRGSARDVAEAGRELGRFDSSGWAGELVQPRAVVLTARDRLVPPRRQRALAAALGVSPLVIDADHDACSLDAERFVALLLRALGGLRTAVRQSAQRRRRRAGDRPRSDGRDDQAVAGDEVGEGRLGGVERRLGLLPLHRAEAPARPRRRSPGSCAGP